jgi:hypothetical protein
MRVHHPVDKILPLSQSSTSGEEPTVSKNTLAKIEIIYID